MISQRINITENNLPFFYRRENGIELISNDMETHIILNQYRYIDEKYHLSEQYIANAYVYSENKWIHCLNQENYASIQEYMNTIRNSAEFSRAYKEYIEDEE